MKRIALLGATGSIGRQALEIIDANPDLEACALASGSNELDALAAERGAGSTHLLFGGGVGDAAPAVVNLQNILTLQRPRIKQVFFGLSRPLSYAELMVVGDYLDIGGSERVTLTLSCTVPLDARTAKP